MTCHPDSDPLLEEVLVHLDDLHRPPHLHPDAVPDHQRRQPLAVDEHDPSGHPVGVLAGLRTKAPSRDEYALVGRLPVQRADEALDLGAPDARVEGVALGLDVNAVSSNDLT